MMLLILCLLSLSLSSFGADVTVAKSGKFSDTATFSTGKLPAEKDNVLIPKGMSLEIDVTTPKLKEIQVDGTLTIAEKNEQILLTVESIHVKNDGEFNIGTPTNLFGGNVRILLTNYTMAPARATDLNVVNHHKMIAATDNAKISWHAKGRNPLWTQISETATVGATSIKLKEDCDWQIGDEIIIAITDHPSRHGWARNGFQNGGSELRVITAVNGRTISFAEPLKFEHFGKTLQYGGQDVPIYAEVYCMTSNVKVEGDFDYTPLVWDQEKMNSCLLGYGGHMVFVDNSHVTLEGIEFYRMGQTGRLARYPVHWHHRLDAPGQYVKRCSIHQSFSRAVTVHDTHQLLVENNAAFDCCGHNFYLEDGTEVANVFKHNLAIGARAQSRGKRANGYKVQPNWPEGFRLDAHDTNPSGFWITNANNTFIDNTVVESTFGYWVKLNHGSGDDPNRPRLTNMNTHGMVFENNNAHSLFASGVWIWHDWTPARGRAGCCSNTQSVDVPSVMKNTFVYKSNIAIESYGAGMLIFEGTVAVDCNAGLTHKFSWRPSMRAVNSLIVGESENHGNPVQCGIDDCSKSGVFPGVMRTEVAASRRIGFSVPKFRYHIDGVTFVNFRAHPERPVELFSSSASPNTPGADRRVFNVAYDNIDAFFDFSFDFRVGKDSNDAYQTAFRVDKTLPCSKGDNGHIFQPTMKDVVNPKCEFRPKWHAYYCPNQRYRDIVSLVASQYHSGSTSTNATLTGECGSKQLLLNDGAWRTAIRVDARADGKPRRYLHELQDQDKILSQMLHNKKPGISFDIHRETMVDEFTEKVEIVFKIKGKYSFELYDQQSGERPSALAAQQQACGCGHSFAIVTMKPERVILTPVADDTVTCDDSKCDPFPLPAPEGYTCGDEIPTFDVTEDCYTKSVIPSKVTLAPTTQAPPPPSTTTVDVKLYTSAKCTLGESSCGCRAEQGAVIADGEKASEVVGHTSNQRCDVGLQCVSDLCVKQTCLPGSAGCVCADGSLCDDENLECNDVDGAQTCVRSKNVDLYGECYKGLPGCECFQNKCFDGAVCAAGVCVTSRCDGEIGCACRDSGDEVPCDGDAQCVALGASFVCLQPALPQSTVEGTLDTVSMPSNDDSSSNFVVVNVVLLVIVALLTIV